MAPLKPRNPFVGKADRLEEEVRIYEAAIRLMDPGDQSSLPGLRTRLERLRALLKAARHYTRAS